MTIDQPVGGSESEHELTRQLLARYSKDKKFLKNDYLKWLYDDQPGRAAHIMCADKEGRRVGHLAALPQTYCKGNRSVDVMSYINFVIDEDARGKGALQSLWRQQRRLEKKSRQVVALGVANAVATNFWRVIFKCEIMPLPIRLFIRFPRSAGCETIAVNQRYLNSREFERVFHSLLLRSEKGWSQFWSIEYLRWRLMAPNQQYQLHIHDSGVAVSCKTQVFGVPVAILLKLFPRVKKNNNNGVIKMSPILKSVSAIHKTPLIVYCGVNMYADKKGLPLPSRMMPSPLNFIFKSFDSDVIKQEEFSLASYEFLDFDAF